MTDRRMCKSDEALEMSSKEGSDDGSLPRWHLPDSQHLRKALPTARSHQDNQHHDFPISLWLLHSISE